MPDVAASSSQPKRMLFLFLGIAGITFMFGIVALFHPIAEPGASAGLFVYCAASLKMPVEKIAADYSRETGVPIELSFGGSQTLLANIDITRRGDLYLPADDSYIAVASEKKLVRETLPLAEQSAVIAVAKGNPKGIRSLAIFHDAPLRLSQANPETAAIGKLLRAAIAPALWQGLSNRTVVFKPNVNDAANDVKLGAVDAAIVWDSMQLQYPDLDFIRAPELSAVKAKVAVAVLSCSTQPEAAQKLAHYITSSQSLDRFSRSGFITLTNQP